MTYKTIIREVAQNDLAAAHDYLESQTAGLTQEFALDFQQTLQRIEDNPLRYAVIGGKTRRVSMHQFLTMSSTWWKNRPSESPG